MRELWVLSKFIICASIIFFAGKRVAKYADVIAEKTGFSRLWIGMVFVAAVTSLPELFTGVGSVVFVDAPDLTVGNLLGANSYNLLNIGLLDLLHRGGPLLSMISSGQLIVAIFSIVPVILAGVAIALSENGISAWSIGNIGIFSIAIFVSYCIATRVIYKFEKPKSKNLKAETKYDAIPLKKAYTYGLTAAAIIIASGVWLAYVGKDLSEALRLSQSFTGNLFIGFVTTLPEITVSIAALFIGAKEIAVANMLGSNLFNMTIVFADDILYQKAPILQVVSPGHLRSACMVIAMTVLVIVAMATKPKRKFFNISWYVPVLFILFLLGAYMNFNR
ncbi:MAG: sodium:calcium antiporter [Candidatus Omnitrophota bacterium]|nr:MAG: sodium:calcium antiporter [Candidatus Omnitrophota bacterium]